MSLATMIAGWPFWYLSVIETTAVLYSSSSILTSRRARATAGSDSSFSSVGAVGPGAAARAAAAMRHPSRHAAILAAPEPMKIHGLMHALWVLAVFSEQEDA